MRDNLLNILTVPGKLRRSMFLGVIPLSRLRIMSRGIRNPGVGKCLGFCTTDLWSSLAYESAEQKPKHCLTPGFLIPLIIGHRPNGFLGLSYNDRTILFLVILLDKTVSVG